MKKTLVSALTTALVVGAASTTFAASNPFSDVPADHWAYDAVSQLAADGVITGYGDSTFQGNRNITRYEMAQMIAKAMAKKDVSAADKAMIDKLAAEFSDELNNLGVRVANLEKHSDNVKWNGKVEYTYTNNKYKYNGNTIQKDKNDHLLFRLEPTATVNDHWDVHARLDASTSLDNDSAVTGESDDTVTLKRAWAQANYKNFTGKFGKFGSSVNDTIVFDDPFSGFGVTFGNALKVTAEAGRVNSDTLNFSRGKLPSAYRKAFYATYGDDPNGYGYTKPSNYQGIGLSYDFGKLGMKAAYQHFDWNSNVAGAVDDLNIWSVGANYAFDKNVNLNAEYAKGDENWAVTEDAEDKAYVFELNYKGAQQENKGTWGAWAAYRYLGSLVALDPTYDAIKCGYKGWEIGGNYTLAKNIVTTLRYGDTKNLFDNDLKLKQLFGRVEFFF